VATTTINVTEEAYEALKSRKREGESFTDVVLRLAGDRPLSEVAGTLNEGQGQALASAIERSRDRSRKRRDDQRTN
jgi:predicted CopG family antitoxin